jgi:hypothetical protein
VSVGTACGVAPHNSAQERTPLRAADREERGREPPYGRALDLGGPVRRWERHGTHGRGHRLRISVATEDATFLMYAFSPGRRGPLPRGISREEIERAYEGWTIIDEEAFDLTRPPALCRKHTLAGAS